MSATDTVIATVVGRGPDTGYVVVEGDGENQFAVTPRVFAGDWHALERGDVVELEITPGVVARVLAARLLRKA